MRPVLKFLLCNLIAFGFVSGVYGLTIPASEDTVGYLNKLTPGANAAPNLMVDATHTAFLYFNLNEVPQDAVLRWAKLRLFLPSVRVKGAGLGVHVVTGAWDEALASNQPVVATGTVATIGPEKLGTRRFVTVDVTSTVQSWIRDPATNEGFAIKPISGGSAASSLYLTSKDGASLGLPAELDLDFKPAVEAITLEQLPASVRDLINRVNITPYATVGPIVNTGTIASAQLRPNTATLTLLSGTSTFWQGPISGTAVRVETGTFLSGLVRATDTLSTNVIGPGAISIGTLSALTNPLSNLTLVNPTFSVQSNLLNSNSITLLGVSGQGPVICWGYPNDSLLTVGTVSALSVNGLNYGVNGLNGGILTLNATSGLVTAGFPSVGQPVVIGAELTVSAHGTAPLSYQWLRNGVAVSSGTAATLSVAGLTSGTYSVRVSNSVGVYTSVAVQFVPVSFALAPIPGGTYTIGDAVRSVTLSPYSMAVIDTTKAHWDTVRAWALTHGYPDLAAGAGKASNHPVQEVTWHDVVKWANAASEKDGLTPCYSVSEVVYRTGQEDAVDCDWSANGYRLPTEAEWEVAARGGLTGKQFPWGDSISQSQANYYALDFISYDLSGSVNGFNPTYATEGAPYTSPVGVFAANGYGLYDMAGNVFQWCWDWYGTPDSGGSDPRGSATGSIRVLRGGNWSNGAYEARCATRYGSTPTAASSISGFRLARGRP